MKSPLNSRIARIALWVLAAAFLAVVVVPLGAASAPLCGSCHAMRTFEHAVKVAPHATVSCVRCHAASGRDRYLFGVNVIARMAPAALSGTDKVTGPGSGVSSTACESCHAAVFRSVVKAKGLSIEHDACARSVSCESCHGNVSHPKATRWLRSYVMEDCVVCHRESEGPVKCDACHTGRSERERLASGPWQVTHGANWRKTHGLGSTTYCSTCHPDDYCVDCHRVAMPHPSDWGTTHGTAAIAVRSACARCHPGERICSDCHGIRMPHPSGFLKRHSSIAKGQADPSCLTCHADDDCAECHANHIHPGNANLLPGGGEKR